MRPGWRTRWFLLTPSPSTQRFGMRRLARVGVALGRDHHAIRPNVSPTRSAVVRVAPVAHAHGNSLGRYDLHRLPPRAGHLRPLRRADEDSDPVGLTPPLGDSGDDKH